MKIENEYKASHFIKCDVDDCLKNNMFKLCTSDFDNITPNSVGCKKAIWAKGETNE